MIVYDIFRVAHLHGCDLLFYFLDGTGLVQFYDLDSVKDQRVEFRTCAVYFAH